MFGFFRRPAARPLSAAIDRAIQKDGMPPATSDPSQLRMVESGGRYSNRKVTYFRVFLPVLAAQQSLDVRRYDDLDQYQGLILRSGHVEQDGSVILSRPAAGPTAPSPMRTRAGRAVPNTEESVVAGAAVPSSVPAPAEASTSSPTP